VRRNEGTNRLVVRAPNHLGDLVMALPALRSAGPADVVAVHWLVPLLELVREADRERGREPAVGEIFGLDRGARGLLRVAGELRRQRYRNGILLAPSISSALLFRLGGVERRRGTATDRRELLLTDPVDLRRVPRMHRVATYCWLATGEIPAVPPVPRLEVPGRERARWAELLPSRGAPRVGIFPGSNASSRRWDPERFAAVARSLAGQGLEVVVFGVGAERALTAQVAGEAAIDLGGRTDLGLLAAGLEDCSVVLSNDSGPLHLAAAVGTTTVSLWGAGNPASTGVLGTQHRMLRRPSLPCVPCVKNQCPRSGPGYELPEAERECLRLIGSQEVEAEVRAQLDRIIT
jgi:lipopolysaccharide heptosyltransferase II